MRRYAAVSVPTPRAADTIKRYLPDNYEVVWVGETNTVVIAGEDVAGWTLDGYVIPRLASGLHFAKEIEPSPQLIRLVREAS